MPGHHGCVVVVVVVVAQREELKEIHGLCDICYVPFLPVNSHKMRLRLTAVHTGRIGHCPVHPTAPKNIPMARSQRENGKGDAGPHAGHSVGPGIWHPIKKNDRPYFAGIPKFIAVP